MNPRPSGTVSFLFTDVAGSTRLWDADRQGMSGSLAAHDRILEAAITGHAGYIFSTAGDSFAAAFATAGMALAAAMKAQLALGSEPWSGPPIRVRMGVHTGSPEERAGNYFGPEVNRAARVMSAANGGQILMSGATAQLMASELVPPLWLADRGTHALKDLDRPEHLFELRHPDLPEVADPLHTVETTRVHLPAQLTSFVGRRNDLESVAALLETSRLVTLTGIGGTGKTRLSVEAATTIQNRFPDGVWMVELAPVADPALVVNQVAQLWGLRPGEGVALIQVIKTHLANRTLLLVVDNCEHVLEAAAGLVSEVLSSCRGVSVLATSRESLGVRGEAVFRVPSLGLPSGDSDAAASEAVQLFCDRASRVRSDFAGPASDLHAIVRICRRLDGIPLGIELAAARLRTLSTGELADRLEDSFLTITGGSKTSIPRQRTLQAAFDWSYDLLDENEAALFRCLAVFAGGFDLAAAEVVGAGGVNAREVLDILDQLVDKSLVVVGHGDEGARFRLLEPIRQYAQERLAAQGEATAVHLAHARHYAAVVAATAPRLRGPDQRQANWDLLRELDNIRSSLDTLLDRGDADEFLETCFHLGWFWSQSSLQVEGRETVLAGLESLKDQASPAAAAKAWWAASMLAVFLTDPRGVWYAERGLESARAADDDVLVGWLSLALGVARSTVGNSDEEGDPSEAGRRLIVANRDRPMWDPEWDTAAMELFLGIGGAGSPEERYAHFTEAIARAQALGDGYLAATAMSMASFLFGAGHDEWVLARLEESVTILRRLGFRHALGHALFYFGARSQQSGVGEGAEELAEASTMLAEVGDLPCSTWSAGRLIGVLLDTGRLEEAGRYLATAAGRLLVFERNFDEDLAALACRRAVATGDFPSAARFLGHAERRADGPADEALAICRRAIEAGLPSEVEMLTSEGGAADRRRVLEWIADSMPGN